MRKLKSRFDKVQLKIDSVNVERIYLKEPQKLVQTSYFICASEAALNHCQGKKKAPSRSQRVVHSLSFPLLPYFNYCVEIWGNTETLHLSCILQKQAIRIVNKVVFHNRTNMLVLKLHASKFMDLVEYNTIQIIHEDKIYHQLFF